MTNVVIKLRRLCI